MPKPEDNLMGRGRGLPEQLSERLVDRQDRADGERAGEVQREVFEIVPVTADGVVGLPLEPCAENRLGGVLAAGGDGERRREGGARLPASDEGGGGGHRAPPVATTTS